MIDCISISEGKLKNISCCLVTAAMAQGAPSTCFLLGVAVYTAAFPCRIFDETTQ
jgi:hypothetical protein